MTTTSDATTSRFKLIDGLRAVAACSVVAFHFYGVSLLNEAPLLPGPFHELVLEAGTAGVCIFFVLSGFVISHSLRHGPVSGKRVLRFGLARSVRLDPPYWLAIGLTLLTLALGRAAFADANLAQFTLSEVLLNVAYLQDLLRQPRLVVVAWTLCLEIQFYLVLATLFWLAERLSRYAPRSVVESLLFGPLTLYSLAVILGAADQPWPGLFVSHWALFMLGVLVRDALFMPGRGPVGGVTFALCLLPLFWVHNIGLQSALLTAAVVLLAGRRGRLVDGLGQRPVQAVGRWSYSLYLVHPIIGCNLIRLLRRGWAPPHDALTAWMVCLVAVVASLAAAFAMYTFVERPAHRLSRRLKTPGSTGPR